MHVPRNITIGGRRWPGGRYPFDEIPIGGSFLVPPTRASYITVREMVYRRNKKNKGFFECSEVDGGTLVARCDPNEIAIPSSMCLR